MSLQQELEAPAIRKWIERRAWKNANRTYKNVETKSLIINSANLPRGHSDKNKGYTSLPLGSIPAITLAAKLSTLDLQELSELIGYEISHREIFAELGSRMASTKTADYNGVEILTDLLGKEYVNARKKFYSDKGLMETFRVVLTELTDALNLSQNQQASLRRFRNLVKNIDGMDPDEIRNQLNKVADQLGVNIPSARWASDKTATTRYNWDGKVLTLKELVRYGIAKYVERKGSEGFSYGIIVARDEDYVESTFLIPEATFLILDLPDTTPMWIKEDWGKAMMRRYNLPMRDSVDFNMMAKAKGWKNYDSEAIRFLEKNFKMYKSPKWVKDRGILGPSARWASDKEAMFGRDLPSGNDLFSTIRSGDRVTILDRFGKELSGKASMYNKDYDIWVLNMGGAHGRPGEANRDNVVKVSKGRSASSKEAAVENWQAEARAKYFGSKHPEDSGFIQIPTPEDLPIEAWMRSSSGQYFSVLVLTPRTKVPKTQFAGDIREAHGIVDKEVEYMRAKIEQTRKRNDVRRQQMTDLEPSVGDILYTSWGYDQTNVNFYQVVGVPSPAMVVIREIGSKEVADSKVVAAPNIFVGPPVRKKIRPSGQGGKSYAVKITGYSSAYVWDGNPKYVTPWGYGH
jgi:hypothetical protein